MTIADLFPYLLQTEVAIQQILSGQEVDLPVKAHFHTHGITITIDSVIRGQRDGVPPPPPAPVPPAGGGQISSIGPMQISGGGEVG